MKTKIFILLKKKQQALPVLQSCPGCVFFNQLFANYSKFLQKLSRTLTRLPGCTGCSESLLGIHTITKTCLYNVDPHKPHFYIVKLGFTGVYIIFLISAQNTDCGYSLELPRWGLHCLQITEGPFSCVVHHRFMHEPGNACCIEKVN